MSAIKGFFEEVSAQPSLPLLHSTALDVEQETFGNRIKSYGYDVVTRTSFREDFRCRAARFERLEASLQSAPGSVTQRFLSIVVPGKGHATLNRLPDGA